MLLERLRSHFRLTLMFALIGALSAELATLLEWMDRYERNGFGHVANRLPREMACVLAGAVILLVCLRLSTPQGGDLIRRPVKFAVTLMLAAALACSIGWELLAATSGGRLLYLPGAEKFYDIWSKAMLWGGLVGWMYLLSLQRAESHARLSGLLGQRVLLARQLASARLGTARAQFDPAMVARILSEVHARYRVDPASAASLLDNLISYLRLAMNRAREDRSSLVSDAALATALAVLTRAEQQQGEARHVA